MRARAFAMPLTSPAYPVGPYRFVNREFLIITYRTDPQKLRELVPEPLQIEEPLVKFEFIRIHIQVSAGGSGCGCTKLVPDRRGSHRYQCEGPPGIRPNPSCADQY